VTDDIFAYGDAQQIIQGYSDSELLALWTATETVEQGADDVSPREALFIDLAAQELARRALLPG
jgi:hypothetical protein